MKEEFACAYCDEVFESEKEKGVHIAEDHVDPSENIPRVERSAGKKINVTNSWDKGSDSE